MTSLLVPDMTCKHCVATITKLIQDADPKADLNIDLPSHTVDVTSELSAGALVEILEDAGYSPEEK